MGSYAENTQISRTSSSFSSPSHVIRARRSVRSVPPLRPRQWTRPWPSRAETYSPTETWPDAPCCCRICRRLKTEQVRWIHLSLTITGWRYYIPMTISHVKKLELTEMKMCRWACGHTPRYHMRNDDIRERLEVLIKSQRGARKQDWGGLNTWRGETKNSSEERLRWWIDVGEEEDEDRSIDGWNVSTETWGNKTWSTWQNWLDDNFFCRSDPTIKWERLEEEYHSQ